MRILSLALVALLPPLPLMARDVAGQFDYYVLAVSWQPSWCASTGDDRDAPECKAGTARDFSIHGLWPQNESGWPEYCNTRERDPSRRESQAMSDVMGSGGLAWYQWQKHGRCTGLSSADYYQTTRDALQAINIPQVFDDLARDISIPPTVIEDAFIEANPDFRRDGITIGCRSNALTEVRICLTRDLEPRDCAPDARRDCSQPSILMEQVR
ncbi:ribonuclease T2 [Paracoccus sp. JM45]|uniref:ribonuclease T2 family protein n=1 Tax=Paracoccus sp. JM45 TaxID=2283626 RepID=UPI000E6C037B|nr:ribonuclease T2 [Paracoccus sp. JM45]RJE80389.1 ribonuclease T [Paracoccus sp. JM45]